MRLYFNKLHIGILLTTILFLLSCFSPALWAKDSNEENLPTLDTKIEKQICSDYLAMLQQSDPENQQIQGLKDDDIFIVTYYGNYRDMEVIIMDIKGSTHPLIIEEVTIGDYKFTFSTPSSERFLVYSDGTFSTVKEAYEQKKLSKEDIKAIYQRHLSMEAQNHPFTDVVEKDWFYGAVRYAYTNSLFKGVSETTFEPNSAMTRGMLAVVLYRIEGEPKVEGAVAFTDVPADQYYYNAVLWANQKGIVNGTSETTFAPNDKITREQLATMMMRYAKFKGEDVDKVADLGIYKDNAQISDWAREGLRWANATGLITGRTVNTIDPQGNATRAEVATVLMRFLEK